MSVFNTKADLNRLFPFAKKKPNIPSKLLDKVDTKINKHSLFEDKCINISESLHYDILTENDEKDILIEEKICINDNSNNNVSENHKILSFFNDNSEINNKIKKCVIPKSCNIPEVINIEEIKKPKENYQRWNIPFSSKFKGKDFDKTLLTMQDLIYYNPVTNPIIKEPKNEPKLDDDPDNDLLPLDSDEKPPISNNCITPCIKVGADGKIVIDQETLTLNETGLEEKREELAKAKVIEESAFHSRISSYKRKKEPSKQWSKNETLKFYKCLMNLGTDFSMIGQYFPNRTRTQIKRKYKTEEKKNPQLINCALTNTTHYDSVLIENMFQKFEDEPKEKMKEKNVTVKVGVNSQTRKQRCDKDLTRLNCTKISVCAFVMDKDVLLKNKRNDLTNNAANCLKGEVVALKTIKSCKIKTKTELITEKNIKKVNNIKKEKNVSKINGKKDNHVPKVRKLQDFHEEYEENITKYEENSNSDEDENMLKI